jgi:hypothetical protein
MATLAAWARSLVRRELPALEREVGPRYYDVIIEPLVF